MDFPNKKGKQLIGRGGEHMNKMPFSFRDRGLNTVGMGQDSMSSTVVCEELFTQASDTLNVDFRKLCFEGPESDLLQTQNVQPAVTLINIACLKILNELAYPLLPPQDTALGEYAALYSADVMDFIDLIRLVGCRGVFMKEAADKNRGHDRRYGSFELDTITRICNDVREVGYAEIANLNSPKQVIISGEVKALERVLELVQERSVKARNSLKGKRPLAQQVHV